MKKLSLLLAFVIILGLAVPVLANDYPIYTEEKAWALGEYTGTFGDDGEFKANIYEKEGVIQADVVLKGFLDEDLEFTDLAEVDYDGEDDDKEIEINHEKARPHEIDISMEFEDGVWKVEIEEEHYDEKEVSFIAKKLDGENPDADKPVAELEDDEPSSWAKEEVEKAIALNLVPDDLDDDYREPIDREEFAELAIQVVKSSRDMTEDELEKEAKDLGLKPVKFVDTDDDEVLLASALGIVQGDGEAMTYRPDDSISRQEAAVLLNNLLDYLVDVKLKLTDEYIEYADSDEIADWADGSIQVMAKVNGHNKAIMGGKGNNIFDPKGTYTVEEAIISTYRLAGAVDHLK